MEEPALGRKGFFPFKFLNSSRSVEVQTTEPRKLKRRSTKGDKIKSALSNAQLPLFCFHYAPASSEWTAAPQLPHTKSTHCIEECVQLAKEQTGCWLNSPVLFNLPPSFFPSVTLGARAFSLSGDY